MSVSPCRNIFIIGGGNGRILLWLLVTTAGTHTLCLEHNIKSITFFHPTIIIVTAETFTVYSTGLVLL